MEEGISTMTITGLEGSDTLSLFGRLWTIEIEN